MTVSPFWGVLMVGRIRQFAADGTLPKVVCRFCHSEISHGASKCVVCGSFQNWRRHLQFSSTVLSLLVALVSVTALATPLLINVLTVQDSEISARVIEAEVLLVNRSATLDMVGDSYVVDTLNVCMAAPFLLCARAEVVAGVETKLPAGDLNHHADHELKQANDLGRLHQVLFNLLLFRDKLRSPLIAFANRL